MRRKSVHVVYKKQFKKWFIIRGKRSNGSFAYKSDAVKDARRIAIHHKCEVVIHDKKGVIRQKRSYGNDPRTIKG